MTAASWEEVRAQPAAVAQLRAALAADEVAHAWLLLGPRGVGQRAAIRALAAALNCRQPPGPEVGCGSCDDCEKLARGVHPALIDLEPQGASYLVEDVREEWLPLVTRTMPEHRRRVVRITQAERMNEASQNAFLKVLEEPPSPSLVWVLEAEQEGPLLETIVSRCRRLDFVPWGPRPLTEEAEELGLEEARRPALVRAALGSPERLADLADPDVAEARCAHLALLDRLATGGPGEVVPAAKERVAWARSRTAPVKERNQRELADLEDAFAVDGGRGWPPGVKGRLTRRFERRERQEQRRALDLFLDDLASYLRDLLAVQAGADTDALVNLDHEAELRRDAARLPSRDALSALEAVARCREALDRNGSPELQVERLLYAVSLPLYAAA